MSDITLPLFDILDAGLSVPVFVEGDLKESPSVNIEFDATTGIRTLDDYLWEANEVTIRVHTVHPSGSVNKEDALAIKEGVRGLLEPRITVNEISQYVPPPDISDLQYDQGSETAYDILLEYEFKNSTLLAQTGGDDGEGGQGGICALKEDLEAQNTSVGNIDSGDFFEAGTKLEALWRALLIQAQPPTLSLSGTGSDVVEIGTEQTITLTSNFDQRQGGPLLSHSIEDIDFGTDNPATLERTFTVGSPEDIQASVSFSSQASHDESADFGAGTVTASKSYQGRRVVYRGHSNPEPTTAADVTSLSGESPILNAQAGLTFNIDVPSGATSVEFAYPAALGDVSLIEFQGAITRDDTDNYEQTTVTGVGKEGYEIDYFVYRQAPADPYSNVDVEVTI